MSDNREPLALPVGVDRVSDLGTLYTLKETATRLGLSVKTVRRMVDRGDFPGAHLAPMSNGKGSQWVVPYSEVVRHENTQTKHTAQVNPQAGELQELREKVAKLEHDLEIQSALATERQNALEQLHLTVRLALQAPPAKRGLFRKRTKG